MRRFLKALCLDEGGSGRDGDCEQSKGGDGGRIWGAALGQGARTIEELRDLKRGGNPIMVEGILDPRTQPTLSYEF